MNKKEKEIMHENHKEDEMQVDVKGIITSDNYPGKVLCVQKTEKYDNQWEIPGGRIKSYEWPEEELRREIIEELGVQCEIKKILIAGPAAKHKIFKPLFYVLYEVIISSEKIKLSDEHQDFRWMTPEEVNNEEKFNITLKHLITQLGKNDVI